MKPRVALLRGVNVGGRKTIPIPDLRALSRSGGLSAVETCLQSGNLMFDCAPSDAAGAASAIEGFQVV